MTPIENPSKLFCVLATYSNGAIYYMWVDSLDQAHRKAQSWKTLSYNLILQ